MKTLTRQEIEKEIVESDDLVSALAEKLLEGQIGELRKHARKRIRRTFTDPSSCCGAKRRRERVLAQRDTIREHFEAKTGGPVELDY